MRARYSRTRNFLSDPLRPYSRLTLKNRSRENGSYRRRGAARVAAWAARSWWAASVGGPAGRTRCTLGVGDMWVMAGAPRLGDGARRHDAAANGRGARTRRPRVETRGALLSWASPLVRTEACPWSVRGAAVSSPGRRLRVAAPTSRRVRAGADAIGGRASYRPSDGWASGADLRRRPGGGRLRRARGRHAGHRKRRRPLVRCAFGGARRRRR